LAQFRPRRTDTSPLRSRAVASPWLAPPRPPARFRVPSVGNRQRPHHGGTHARRIHGTSTCHHSPSPRPSGQGHLPGPGPLRVLVPQVVAPLPAGGRRGPVRPHAPHPPRRPAHPPP